MNEIRLIAIGASTGGPAVIGKLLSDLPSDFLTPIVITQHVPHDICSSLAKQLSEQSQREILVAYDHARLSEGTIWLAPYDFHLGLEKNEDSHRSVVLRLRASSSEHGYRPAIDPMLKDAATIFGAGTMAVILTGLGRDGVVGCKKIHEAGGIVIIQGPKTSAVWGIPSAISQHGYANAIVERDFIATEIINWSHKRARPSP